MTTATATTTAANANSACVKASENHIPTTALPAAEAICDLCGGSLATWRVSHRAPPSFWIAFEEDGGSSRYCRPECLHRSRRKRDNLTTADIDSALADLGYTFDG